MDDDFLGKFRKEPRPAFARSLYQRINEPMKKENTSLRRLLSWKLAFAGIAALVVAALVVSPGARVLAQDFLNLFRVKRFAAVTLSTERMQQLENGETGIEQVLSAGTEVLTSPGKPIEVDGLQSASLAAGFTVRVPAVLPRGVHLQEITVQGEGSVRFTADVARLQSLLQVLDINDVQLPPQLDGQTITINKPPVVMMRYGGDREVLFLQSRNPQVELPAGVDLAQLGELALRVAGMTAEEARQFSRNIDWNSTLLVPVPAYATSFREVEVRGVTGLLVASDVTPTGRYRDVPSGSVLMWAEGDMVYALSGAPSTSLVDTANSIE